MTVVALNGQKLQLMAEVGTNYNLNIYNSTLLTNPAGSVVPAEPTLGESAALIVITSHSINCKAFTWLVL